MSTINNYITMAKNALNEATPDVGLVTMSCVSKKESLICDRSESDFDSAQSDYISSSFYVDSVTGGHDGNLQTDISTKSAMPHLTDNAVETNFEDTESGNAFDKFDVKKEVIEHFNMTEMVPTDLTKFKLESDIKITDSECVVRDQAAVNKVPSCDSKNILEHISLVKTKTEIEASLDRMEVVDPLDVSGDDSQDIKSKLHSADQDRINIDTNVKTDRGLVRNFLVAAEVKLKKPVTGKHDYEPKYNCEYCVKSFAGRTNYEEHLRVHTREKPYGCQHCRKYFAQKSQLNFHLRIHSDVKPFQCDFCGKMHRRKEDLQYDVYTHIKLIAFTCIECNQGFTTKHQLRKHKAYHQRGEYPCRGCTRKYSDIDFFKKHMQFVEKYGTHDDTSMVGKSSNSRPGKLLSPLTCDYCQKLFYRRFHLVQHIRIHLEERPYTCEICNRKFKQYSTLKCHSRLHTGQKPFECELCKARFFQKHHLLSHLKKHNIQFINHGSESNRDVVSPEDLIGTVSLEHAEI